MAWPSMGWQRYGRMLWLRLKRISVQSSSESVAAGLSFGWFISFNPLLGTHTLWAFICSMIFGFNFVASVIGSLVGNIWTFPILLWISYEAGVFVLTLLNMMPEENVGNTLYIMMVGWLVTGPISFVVSYPLYYYLVKSVKRAYRRAKELKEKTAEKDNNK